RRVPALLCVRVPASIVNLYFIPLGIRNRASLLMGSEKLLAFKLGKRTKTPELSLSGGIGPEFVGSGLKESQSSFRTKLRKTSRVYQRRPIPPWVSRIDPKRLRNPPGPAICQPSSVPAKRSLNAGF